jgi:hypothetical protein
MALPRRMTALGMGKGWLRVILFIAALRAKLGNWVNDFKVGKVHHFVWLFVMLLKK